jgi:metal-dependent amidase/aminoacylase/carboxypeptidase family protein
LNDRARGITTNVGLIEGGTARNTVAEDCTIEVDLRFCESAWNKDPVFGVIGIQSGPRG